MSKTNGKTIEICGREFRTAKNGLDESQVASFIESLTAENDELSQQLENVDSLMRQAENTIVEAGRQAKSIETEIEEEAQAKAASVIAEAEERAKADADKIIADVRENARAETARIQEEAEQLRVSTRQRVEGEIRERFQAVCTDLFPERNEAETPVAEALQTQSDPDVIEEAETAAADTSDLPGAEPTEGPTQPAMEAEALDESGEEDPAEAVTCQAQEDACEDGDAIPEPCEAEDSTSSDPADLLESPDDGGATENDDMECQGEAQIIIPPPIALDRVLRIHRELKDNRQIEIRCFAVSAEDGVKVDLVLPDTLPLKQLLRSLPGVSHVETVSGGGNHPKRRKADKSRVTVLQVSID
jgi:vacuolar-type H+-ATPase subunit H